MERINAKDVQSMMEAYSSIYNQPEVEYLDENKRADAAKANRKRSEEEARVERVRQQNQVRRALGAGRGIGLKGATSGVDQGTGYATTVNGREGIVVKGDSGALRSRQPINVAGRTLYPAKRGNDIVYLPSSEAPKANSLTLKPNNVGAKPNNGSGNTGGTQNPKPQPKPQQSPSSNLKPGSPNVTKDGIKFERRTPTMAELRAAQAARRAAPKVLSRAEIEKRALKAAVGEGQRKPPTAPPPVSSTKPAVTPAAKPAVTAAGNKVAELAALRAKAKADTMKKKQSPDTSRMGARNRMRNEELDVFDTIKEYLIGEGATEEEALKQMLTLTDEQRTEIIEGSCGSKKKKSKKGGY